MIDNGYSLRKAMDGGWLPPREARDIQAVLERLGHGKVAIGIDRAGGGGDYSAVALLHSVGNGGVEVVGAWVGEAAEVLLRWFRMQGQ